MYRISWAGATGVVAALGSVLGAVGRSENLGELVWLKGDDRSVGLIVTVGTEGGWLHATLSSRNSAAPTRRTEPPRFSRVTDPPEIDGTIGRGRIFRTLIARGACRPNPTSPPSVMPFGRLRVQAGSRRSNGQ